MTKKELIQVLEELGDNLGTKKESKLISKLEKNLNFKDEEQHQSWLSVLFSFKFWEDFEELTEKIIKQNKPREKMITLTQFYKEEHELEQSGTAAQISKHRKIWDLASRGWTLSKVGESRMKKAAQLLRTVHQEWNAKDKSLEWDQWDNDHARRMRQRWDNKDDEAIAKLKRLCKALGLTLEMSTFAHIVAHTPNGTREIL